MAEKEPTEYYTMSELARKAIEDNRSEIDQLKCAAEKYKAAYEDAKKERDKEVCKFRNEIDKLKAENSELHDELQAISAYPPEFPEEPIKVADMIISAKGAHEENSLARVFGSEYQLFSISEIRQIAEHLLVYCNANEGREDE